jgi:hypothetical protein
MANSGLISLVHSQILKCHTKNSIQNNKWIAYDHKFIFDYTSLQTITMAKVTIITRMASDQSLPAWTWHSTEYVIKYCTFVNSHFIEQSRCQSSCKSCWGLQKASFCGAKLSQFFFCPLCHRRFSPVLTLACLSLFSWGCKLLLSHWQGLGATSLTAWRLECQTC